MNDLERFIDEADRITGIDMTVDTKALRNDGMTLDPKDFTVERFDRMVQAMREQSNAETFEQTLSGLFTKDQPISGEIKMIVSEDGIVFEGLEGYLPQVYAILVPDRAEEAKQAAESHLANRRDEVESQIKSLFWKNTAKFMYEDLGLEDLA